MENKKFYMQYVTADEIMNVMTKNSLADWHEDKESGCLILFAGQTGYTGLNVHTRCVDIWTWFVIDEDGKLHRVEAESADMAILAAKEEAAGKEAMQRAPAKPCPVDRGKLMIGLECCRNVPRLCEQCPYYELECDAQPVDALAYIGWLEEVAGIG